MKPTMNKTNEDADKYALGLILADPAALRMLGTVLTEGAEKHGRSNIGEGWYEIPAEVHLAHALNHIFLWRTGDTQEDHLAHAQCRVHMALAVELRQKLREISKQNWD